MVMKGIQKPIAVPSIRVSLGVALITTVTTMRAIAPTVASPRFTTVVCLGLYFICRTEFFGTRNNKENRNFQVNGINLLT